MQEGFNKFWFLAINSHAGHNHSLDFIAIVFAQYTPYLFIGMLFYLWFSKRKDEALFAGYAATLGIVLNQLIGILYFHPRPFMGNLGYTLLSHKAENSFPSDHTTFLFSIALILLTLKSTRILGVFAVLFSFVCGVSRIYCGVHWPYDIIGSIMVSISVVSTIYCFKKEIIPLNKYIIALWNKIISRNSFAK
jgi:undecaprenyl-diphosphatase